MISDVDLEIVSESDLEFLPFFHVIGTVNFVRFIAKYSCFSTASKVSCNWLTKTVFLK